MLARNLSSIVLYVICTMKKILISSPQALEELVSLNARLEEKLAERLTDRANDTLDEEIEHLEELAAALIRARADNNISRVVVQIDAAIATARQLLKCEEER